MNNPLLTVTQAMRNRRITRHPKHSFFLRHRPWQIQPFAIAPMLPGETLVKAQLQARSVTDPIDNRVIGWWDEFYLFWVPWSALEGYGVLQEMLMVPDTAVNAVASQMGGADNARTYSQADTAGTNVDYVSACLMAVTRAYFRTESEDWDSYLIPASGGLPSAQISQNNWIESGIAVADLAAGTLDPDLTSTTAGEGDGTAAVKPSEIQIALEQYEWARSMTTTELTFEDFLETYGIVLPQSKNNPCELLRYSRAWQYPSNTIDPSTGGAKSAVSWSHQVLMSKKKTAKEPGFIFGVTVTRPKVYLKNLNSQAVGLLNNSRAWLNPLLMRDGSSSFVKLEAGEPPLDNSTEDVVVDIKDLYLHGDQFINFDHSATTNANVVDLPNGDLTNVKYPSATDADNLFATKTAGTGKVEKDGVLSLHISGRQAETSPVKIGQRYPVDPG